MGFFVCKECGKKFPEHDSSAAIDDHVEMEKDKFAENVMDYQPSSYRVRRVYRKTSRVPR